MEFGIILGAYQQQERCQEETPKRMKVFSYKRSKLGAMAVVT